MEKIVIAALIIVLLLVVWMSTSSTEHAYLAAPTFGGSLTDKYRSYIKDPTGMTVNDYALAANLTQDVPLSGEYKIL